MTVRQHSKNVSPTFNGRVLSFIEIQRTISISENNYLWAGRAFGDKKIQWFSLKRPKPRAARAAKCWTASVINYQIGNTSNAYWLIDVSFSIAQCDAKWCSMSQLPQNDGIHPSFILGGPHLCRKVDKKFCTAFSLSSVLIRSMRVDPIYRSCYFCHIGSWKGKPASGSRSWWVWIEKFQKNVSPTFKGTAVEVHRDSMNHEY